MISAQEGVSIGLPFLNPSRYLVDAIRSVFAQSHRNWELILIDDGSSDDSVEIARSIMDPRVRLISDGENRGLAARLNQVSQLARYDYVARMDADDLMVPERLEIELSLLRSKPTIDVVSSGVYSVSDDLELIGVRGAQHQDFTFSDVLYGRKSIVHAAIVARKAWCSRNPYDESVRKSEDADLWLRASKMGDLRALTIPEPLYVYREAGNVSLSKNLEAYRFERTHLARHIDQWHFRWAYLARSYAKEVFRRGIELVGKEAELLRRRNRGVLDDALFNRYHSALAEIFQTPVPGLD